MEQAVKTKKYYNEINLLRGFAVLMIVLVHSTPHDDFVIPERIHLLAVFLMSVFFTISGFVNASKLCGDKGFKENALKQIRHLFVPYFAYSVLAFVLKFVINQVEADAFWGILIGHSPCIILWFIWVLFVTMEISILIAYCFSKAKVKFREAKLLIIGIIIYVIALFVDLGFMERVASCFLYIYLGAFLRKHYETFKRIITNKFAGAVILALSVGVFVINPKNTVGVDFIVLVGIWLVFILIAEHFRKSVIYTLLDRLGAYSFEIYLWSYFVHVGVRMILVNILHCNDNFTFIMMFLSGLIVPYFMSVMCKKYKLILR